MYLRIKDAYGNPLRMGDRVLLKDEKASYYGIIERDREFCVPMVRVLRRRYAWQSGWEDVTWRTTQYQVLMGRKRYPFTRRLKGVYLQPVIQEEYSAPLPYAI